MMAAPNYPCGRPLSLLLASLVPVRAEQDCIVSGLEIDSRVLRPGDLFLALAGGRRHGLEHLPEALERGAAAVAYEPAEDLPRGYLERCRTAGVACVAVPGLSARAGLIAARFYDEPSAELGVVGITGTDGKTSVSQFLAQALSGDGSACGVIGTLGYGLLDDLEPASHTTPDAVRVQRLLARLRDQGAGAVAMEVSSHGLDQGRVNGVRFACAVLSNLSRDHLDYHGSLEAYAEAKAKLFHTPGLRYAVLNVDDAFGRRLAGELHGPALIRYSLEPWAEAELRCLELRCRPAGLDLRVATPEGERAFQVPLLGRFNAANVLAVLGALRALGLPETQAVERLSRLRPVPGRMERFGGGGRPSVVVDYAHTPGALAAALAAVREHVPGRLWVVFGCGGDRDRGKRPLMAQAAEAGADELVLTDDNPRSEDGEAIIRDMLSGLRRARPQIIRDRRQAITAAVGQARAGDVILVAGKGHESEQIVGERRLPFSDRALAEKLVGRARR